MASSTVDAIRRFASPDMRKPNWLVVTLFFAASCGEGKTTRREVATSGTLTLLREKTLAELLVSSGHYEASGIAFDHDRLRIVFDNSTHVATVDLALSNANLGPGSKSASQYEGITIATRPAPKTYVVKEIGAGSRGAIVTLDERGTLVSTEATDIAFDDTRKGLEGIAWLDDVERLLVLCEANSCGAGDQSAGHGLIKALRHESGSWVTEETLALPRVADFDDYSDVAVLPESDGSYRIAVLSQESSALWIGTVTTRPLAIAGPGVVYGFPTAAGRGQYCSLEGVTFIDRTTLAMASDRSKSEDGCTKGEAVHVFAVP